MISKYNIIFLLLTALLIAASSGCVGPGPEETERFSGDYGADENTVLRINNVNGQITINNWNGNTIALDATKRTRYGKEELEKVEIIVTQRDDEIIIETEYTPGARVSVDMDIKVPDDVVVEHVKTSNGAIRISGTSGDTTSSTSNAAIEISDTTGNIKASTSNGAIVVSDSEGDITASTSNGAIRITDVRGYIKASTSNSRIDIQTTEGIDDLETSNGAIHAEIFAIRADVDIKSSNGAIVVDIDPSLNANMEIETSNGEIELNDITLELVEMGRNRIEGKLGDGGHTISISTDNGNVELNRLMV